MTTYLQVTICRAVPDIRSVIEACARCGSRFCAGDVAYPTTIQTNEGTAMFATCDGCRSILRRKAAFNRFTAAVKQSMLLLFAEPRGRA
jgi:hypothetical protein